MVLGSAPRSVAPGDEFVVPATMIATQNGVGQVTAAIQADSALFTVVGAARQNLQMPGEGEQIVLFRLRAKETLPVGTVGGHIEITATGGGARSHYGMDIPLRTLELPVAAGSNHTVEAGKAWEGAVALTGMEGTRKLMLEVSTVQASSPIC